MGIKLLRGRAITEADNAPNAPRVMVIDAVTARDLYPGEDPVGKYLNFRGKDGEIVGVVSAVRHSGLNVNPRP
jgi:hypothetical protein